MRVLSVDLGTSNTVAVLSAHGRPPRVVEVDGSATMPSAVFAAEDGAIIVGRDAERRARLDPSRFEPNPKRRVDESTLLLGDNVITVTDALAAVLHRVAEETSRQLGGVQPDEVRLTHPAQWGTVRRNVLLSAARLAGFNCNLVLVPEPVAAAAHFASFPDRTLNTGQALAVYDLGAGTFDCAIVGATQNGFAVLAEDGLADLGGLDVDQALLEHVGRQVSNKDPQRWQRLLRPETTGDRRAQRALREDVRAAKEALSRHPQTEVPMPEPFQDVLITRAELEALVRPSMLRSVELLVAVLRSNGMVPEHLAGIYLVGGSSRLPLVASLIGEQLRIVPTTLDQPETAVALGAHHVSRDGAAMWTQDLRTNPPSGPVAIPYAGQQPQTGYREPDTVRTYPVVAPPRPHFQQSAAEPDSRRNLLIGLGAVAAVAVIVAIVAIVVRATGGTNAPSAAECQQPGTIDAKGFTPCLRNLAGDVPEHSNCAPGWQRIMPGLRELGGSVVSCSIGNPNEGTQIVYTQLDTQEAAQRRADLLLEFNGVTSDQVEAEWSGNGLSGTYRAVTSDTFGTVVFTVDDRPLVGMVLKPNDKKQLDPNTMADEFEQTIQPGTA
ncbi:Hsp70 family protein [Saccharopolyspora phatthalungensis]|uniref:Actin-like ATPase involved in cell morphogenesis n=1 Tax=Saccharopolyspora phatthalungensis TaxID=664693 RepID=A0A840Q8J0_9PSEU|nr:Hsp70 family protein [Saccharopolyspora phatthalungensis]MBB5156247.1 actin-like ATPase involved in cell morphogenesis [Saccharopolyspora phatthalungensis]